MLTWTQSYTSQVGQQINLFITLESAGVYDGDLFVSCPNPCTFLLSDQPSGELLIGYSYYIDEGQEEHDITVSLLNTSSVAIKGVVISTT